MDKRDWFIIGGGAVITALIGVTTYEIEKRRRAQSGSVSQSPGSVIPGAPVTTAPSYPVPSPPYSGVPSYPPVGHQPLPQPPVTTLPVTQPPMATQPPAPQPSQPQIPVVPPAAPTNVQVKGVSGTAVVVSWTPVSGYSRYQVIHPGYESTPEQIVADVQGNSATITGLAWNSPYHVSVAAVGPTGIQGPRSAQAGGSTLA